MNESDSKLERDLANAWKQLNEAMVPIYPPGHPKHGDPNLVYNDDPGEDEEDSPEELQRMKIEDWNNTVDDVEYFLRNAVFEIEDKMEMIRDQDEKLLWNDVKADLLGLQEKYKKMRK